MIGVVAPPAAAATVQEFFELFKTPWTMLPPGHAAPVVLGPADLAAPPQARLVVRLGASETDWDRRHGIRVSATLPGGVFRRAEIALSLAGACGLLYGPGSPVLVSDPGGESLALVSCEEEQVCLRLGFDLWQEVDHLLRGRQTPAQAAFPTLDHLIGLLRDTIVNAGLTLVEVPPVPPDHACIACLTHDVDHPSLRRHRFDHTTAGFLRRATVDTAWQALRGRIPAGDVPRNLLAALELPFVQFGLRRDPWLGFVRYPNLERPAPSTFFVLPRAGCPGRALAGTGSAPRKRASGYAAGDLAPQLEELHSGGCEIALHGIDAWADADAAREERSCIPHRAARGEAGVRMHWLYFAEATPTNLEDAGFSYDSTLGFNQTVGYRAGTAQVFRPPGVRQLLELPLHIMDTALFYPAYLGLTAREATLRVQSLLTHARREGGVVTINWHDRSILPERNWSAFYTALLAMLREQRAWFGTAGQVVAWFRARRSVTFTNGPQPRPRPAGAPPAAGAPGLLLRRHNPKPGLRDRGGRLLPADGPVDAPLEAAPHTQPHHS